MRCHTMIGLVTCRVLPEPDYDQPLLEQAIRGRGASVETIAWDDSSSDFRRYDLLVLRSAWNYYEFPIEFLAWLRQVRQITRVANSPQIVEWNLHKSYLAELSEQGTPIVPSIWLQQGQRLDLRAGMMERGWETVVIKPSISAASFETRRFDRNKLHEGQQFLDRLSGVRDVMVQQYLPSVEDYGERSVVWIDGQVTHSVRKAARFGGDHESISVGMIPDRQERTFAESVIDWVRGRFSEGGPGAGPLYARVDLMRDATGNACLSELELIEPSLFLAQHRPALERLADAIIRTANVPGSA